MISFLSRPALFIWLIFAPLVALAADSGKATADRTATSPHRGQHGSKVEQLRAEFEALGLDANQQQLLKKLAERYRVRAETLRQRGEAIRADVMAVEPDDPRYGEQTERASLATGAIAADAVRLAADFRADVFSILTPAQRQQLRDRASERSKPWVEWRDRHRAGKAGP